MFTLGKPGHALVIPGRRPRREHRVVTREGFGLLWKDTLSVLEEARKGRVQLSSEEVLENFEKLRAQNEPGDKLPEEEWTKLRNTLSNGFTPNQLLGYVKYLQQSPETALDLVNRAKQDAEPSTWRPYTSTYLRMSEMERKSSTESNPGFRNMRGKIVIAEVIMRDYWRLAIRDEIGHLDMHFSRPLLATLQRAPSEPFKAAEGLGVTIEIRAPQHSVRIVGGEDNCLKAQRLINYAAGSVRTREFELPQKGPIFGVDDKELEDTFLHWVQERFNVVCERSEDALKLNVNHTNDMGSDIENALRTLELSTVLSPEQSFGTFTYSAENQSGNLYPALDKDVLPWTERDKEWIRWSKPVRGSGLMEGRLLRRPPDAAYARSFFSPASKISKSLFQVTPEDSWYSIHDSNIREVLTASVGQCLFEQQPSDHKGAVVQISHFENSQPRAFVSDIVHSPHFLRKLRPTGRKKDEITCRIRLIPSSRNAEIVPPIELELHLLLHHQFLGANVIPSLGWATAVLSERSADLLLPDTTLDVRFSRTVHYDLFRGQKVWDSDHDTPVVAELRKCVASLPGRFPLDGPQPQLPAFCSLLIPRRLVRSGNTPPESSPKETAHEYVEAHYIVPPLPYLTAASMQSFVYKDLQLDFSDPSTGPLLAQRRTNLTLSIGRSEDEPRPRTAFPRARLSSAPNDEKTGSLQFVFPQLYNRSCQLAFDLGVPEYGGMPNFGDPAPRPTVIEDTLD